MELEPSWSGGARRTSPRTAYGWASIRQATPGVLGVPGRAPYDRILVSAEAASSCRHALVEQLDDGGRIVVPVARHDAAGRSREGELAVTEHGSYRFVPLR